MSAPKLLFDADILIKLAVFDCFTLGLAALGFTLDEVATMRSMTRSAGVENGQVRLNRAGNVKAASRLFMVLKTVPCIDAMAVEEKELAGAIVTSSIQLGLAIDGGEALLMAIALNRKLPLIATGDKRAIRSLPALATALPAVNQLAGLLIPLELVLLKSLRHHGIAALLSRLHGGADCDASICNALKEAGDCQVALDAELAARIDALRADAPGFIAPL